LQLRVVHTPSSWPHSVCGRKRPRQPSSQNLLQFGLHGSAALLLLPRHLLALMLRQLLRLGLPDERR
jgi:hypothetical protein